MKLFNWGNNSKQPSQIELGKSGNVIGAFIGSYRIDEYNVYSQIKDYRTDLLNGTNWRANDINDSGRVDYALFLNMISKYSISIFNDFCKLGLAVFARIGGDIYYVSPRNYSISNDRPTINGYSGVQTFSFYDSNYFCGEQTIWQKCEPYQKLYNIALSCQRNGMYKSGFVTILTPKTASGANTTARLTDDAITTMEKTISESHGVARNDQNNMLIFQNELNVNTITFDGAKLGIKDAKLMCEEFICSKFGVPHILLPSSGQTYANYEEANKILYENHSKYLEYFCNFVKREIGYDITYKTIAEEGKGIV